MLAGGAGDLGFRIATALKVRGAAVHLLVHRALETDDRSKLERLGIVLAITEPGDVAGMARACEGAACVVSALNGLHHVIVGRQLLLLDAAVKAGVPRMISSDYALDFTKTRLGRNRNLDLRREFMALADRRPIAMTSILNGAFMDMLGAEMPIIHPAIGRVLYWGHADQLLDFTTKDDVAAFTARAALDADAPRILRIAGGSASPRAIAEMMSIVLCKRFKTFRAGGLGSLGVMIGIAKPFGPPGAVFPPYQGMQYMRDMMSGEGRLTPLDNDRYPGLRWTSIVDHLTRVFAQPQPPR